MYFPYEKRKDSRPSSAACCPMLTSSNAAGPGRPKLVFQVPILGIRLRQAAHRGGSAPTGPEDYMKAYEVNEIVRGAFPAPRAGQRLALSDAGAR